MSHADHPINRTLLELLENQMNRAAVALEGVDEATYAWEPGGDCNNIERIAQHLAMIRTFTLKLLESPRIANMPEPESITDVESMHRVFNECADQLRQAIEEYNPDDWYASPPTPREGLWGDEPTMVRVIRPMNDFVNHLGAIRAIRRLRNDGVERTQ